MQKNEKISENANATLIRVEQNEQGQTVVSARELHEFLGSQAKFTDWCQRMFTYGFVENQDYVILHKNVKNKVSKSNPVDYALTLDCAKEISMLQRNDKGKQARQYFIECEKKLKEVQALIAQSTQENIVSLKQDIETLNRNMNIMVDNFNKATVYLQEMQGEIDELKENQKSSTSQLDDTTQRVDKIEEHLDFKSVACVYVMFCPNTKLFKFGSSYNAKTRKKQFSVVEELLEIHYNIPTISREEAFALENALKKRFKHKHVRGEWYALDEQDLQYLYEQQQNNRKHLANMA